MYSASIVNSLLPLLADYLIIMMRLAHGQQPKKNTVEIISIIRVVLWSVVISALKKLGKRPNRFFGISFWAFAEDLL